MNSTIQSIQSAFMDLYHKHAYDKITVKDLCIHTPIARTTFYTYYDNIDDVKNEIEDLLIKGLLDVTEQVSLGDVSHMNFKVFLDATQSYIEKHWDWFYSFMIQQINERFIDKWKEAIKYNFSRKYPDKTTIHNYDLISEVLASATIGAYTYWMKYPDKVNTEDMKEIIIKAINALIEVI